MQVLYPGHRGRGGAQVQDDALDSFVAPDGVKPLAQLLDAEARPAREALPERTRWVGQGRQALLEDEDDVRRRSAERPQEARDEPPQVAEWKKQQPLASTAKCTAPPWPSPASGEGKRPHPSPPRQAGRGKLLAAQPLRPFGPPPH